MRHHALCYVRPVLFVLTTALIIGFACSDKSTGPPEVLAPQIASVSPERGAPGTLVAIKGEHFGNEIGSILFGDKAPYVALWNDTLIKAEAPAQVKAPCYIHVATGEDKKDSIWFVVEYLQIESISPDHGLPGHEVTITGQNFGSSTGTVLFDSLEAEIVSWSSSQITVIVPQNAASCNVEVRSGNMISNRRGFAIDKMTITQIVPDRAIPNTEIAIHGRKFGDKQGAVHFPDALAEVISWSDTLITTKVPIGASSGNVTVEFGGVSSNALSFNVESLAILRIEPDMVLYDSQIEIYGRFYNVDEADVFLDEDELQTISISDTLIVAEIPFGTNSGDISIHAYGQTSNQMPLTVAAMLITSISPTEGIPGTQVTINGLSFGDQEGTVTIDEIEAQITYWSNTRIRCRVPGGVSSGDLVIHVGDEESNAVYFEVHHMTITSVKPNSGIIGQKIAIHGQYFGNSTGSVLFGEVLTQPENWSDTLIQARVPELGSSCYVKVQNSYEHSDSLPFAVININDLTIVQLLQMTNDVQVSFLGYNGWIRYSDHMGVETFDTSYVYNSISFSVDIDSMSFNPNGIYFNGHYHWEVSEGILYDYITIDITGYISADGTSIDSIFAVAYGSHLDDYSQGGWGKEIDAVALPLQSNYDLFTGITYEMSGPGCRDNVLKISDSRSQIITTDMPDNQTANYYFYTDWDNAEYPPKISVIFRQR